MRAHTETKTQERELHVSPRENKRNGLFLDECRGLEAQPICQELGTEIMFRLIGICICFLNSSIYSVIEREQNLAAVHINWCELQERRKNNLKISPHLPSPSFSASPQSLLLSILTSNLESDTADSPLRIWR